ncbi:MAG: hypothetical protein ACRDRH_24570 [Pseudonocardia sp.]
MPNYEMLAKECKPVPDCPQVVRVAPGALVVIGEAITDTAAPAEFGDGPGEAAVRITETLYRAALARLAGPLDTTLADHELIVAESEPAAARGPAVRAVPDGVVIVGEAITDPGALAVFGVGPGEAAVRITEERYRAGLAGLTGAAA